MGKDAVGPGYVDQELVQDIARAVVERVEPGELAVFRRESKAYFRDPQGELKAARKSLRGKAKDEPMGFGADEVAVALAPFVLAVVQGVLTSLAQSLTTTATDRSQAGVGRLLRRMLGRPEPTVDETPVLPQEPGPAQTPPATPASGPEVALSTEQLGRIHAQALRTASDLGLDEERALRLADALVETLSP